jgi:diamine N-acetyltransferase
MAYQVRKAQLEDVPAIHTMIQEFANFIRTPEKVQVTVEQMLRDGAVQGWLVAEADGQLIGFASVFDAYYSWSGKALYLDDLYVREPYRGQGIGQLLLDAVISLARSRGCVKLKWQVSRWNQHAIDFYTRQGAEISDIEINCDLTL